MAILVAAATGSALAHSPRSSAGKPPARAVRSIPARHYGGSTTSLGVHVAPTLQELRQRASSSTLPHALGQHATNLQNYGGPVMSNVVIYNIYWVPDGSAAPNESLIDRFATDLSGPFVNLLSEYGVSNQLNFGGSWVDTKPIPNGPSLNGRHIFQDSDVQGVVTDAQNANPQWQAPGLNTLYMVYLPMHSELCASGNGCTFVPNNSGGGDFCAYHSAFTYSSDPGQTPNIYGAMPWDGDRMNGCATNTVTSGYNGSSGPNGDAAADSEISTASHEAFEALTDPEPLTDPAWTGGNNPIDPNFSRTGEIGDLCAYIYNPTLSDNGDVTLNADRYFIQYEWDNATSSCVLPGSAIPATSLSPGCTDNTLDANDDGSTDAIELPFTLDYFGTSYGSAYVNNNGNITFDQPLSTYTPFSLASTNTAIIAPYFSDVDTRGTYPVPSGLVTYGVTTFDGHQAFCVLWRNVGYFGEHTDKLNSFELLLVQRPDTGPGDFDIVFNYDKLQWETGDASGGVGGLGGSSARAGFSNGDPTTSVELYGSGTPGSLIDSGAQSLTADSSSSAQPGRYIFPVRNGNNAGTSIINGTVTDTATPANPQSGALVEACDYGSGRRCGVAITNALGNYSIGNLPGGDYHVTVSPPSGSSLVEQTEDVTLGANGDVQTLDFALSGPTPPPPGTTVDGVGSTGNGIPVLQWEETTPLTTTGCANGAATYSISAENSQTGGQQTVTGAFTESPRGSGQYSASIPALYPLHGPGTVSISIACPGGQTQNSSFSIYIDPSGTVVDTHGAPIAGATVTLMSADDPNGPFSPVPDGSAVMSPANRTNPDVTRPDGTFGWDVVAGYYVIRAAKPGCTDPNDVSRDYVDSGVLTIPPAVSGLQLVLNCPPSPPADIAPPSISGAATQGQSLTESHGSWTNVPTNYSYQWEDCDSAGNACLTVAGATSQTYSLTAADVGHTIRVLETAINAGGSSSAVASAATRVVQAAPLPSSGPQTNPLPVIPGTTTAAAPTAAQVRAALATVLRLSGKHARIAQLLKHGGYTVTFLPPSAGVLIIRWYLKPKAAHVARGSKPVLVAALSVDFHNAARARVKIALTPKGRKLLRTARHVTLSGVGSFSPAGGATTRITKTILLHR